MRVPPVQTTQNITFVSLCSGQRKSTKINCLGPETTGWGAGLPREGGGGQKVRALPLKFVFLAFGREEPGMSREFCRDVPDRDIPLGVFKKFVQKKFVHIFRSLFVPGIHFSVFRGNCCKALRTMFLGNPFVPGSDCNGMSENIARELTK